MNTFSLNPTDGRTARRAGVKTPTATERLIVFRGRKYLAARSLSLSLPLDACNYWQREGGREGGGEDGNGRWDRLSLSITAPKMRASEPKFMGSGGPIEGGREGGREGGNHRQFEVSGLEYCCGAESAPAWYALAGGGRQRATGSREERGQREGGRPFIAASSKEIGRQEGRKGRLAV